MPNPQGNPPLVIPTSRAGWIRTISASARGKKSSNRPCHFSSLSPYSWSVLCRLGRLGFFCDRRRKKRQEKKKLKKRTSSRHFLTFFKKSCPPRPICPACLLTLFPTHTSLRVPRILSSHLPPVVHPRKQDAVDLVVRAPRGPAEQLCVCRGQCHLPGSRHGPRLLVQLSTLQGRQGHHFPHRNPHRRPELHLVRCRRSGCRPQRRRLGRYRLGRLHASQPSPGCVEELSEPGHPLVPVGYVSFHLIFQEYIYIYVSKIMRC